MAGGSLAAPTNATLTIDESDSPTNPVGSLQLISAALTNSPLTFANNPNSSVVTPQIEALTPDGRYVLFACIANNIANGINNKSTFGLQEQNVFVRDMDTSLVTLVNVTPTGARRQCRRHRRRHHPGRALRGF